MTESIIHKNMTIGEVVNTYPQTAQVLTSFGLHCIGCNVAYNETLEQGAKGHKMEEETFTNMIEAVNKAAQDAVQQKETAQKQGSKLILTDAAIERITQLQSKNPELAQFFRVKVVQGGCSGMSYDFSFEKEKAEQDIIIEKKGARVVVDPESFEMVKGSHLDFVDALQGAGFKVHNPNAQTTCSCGSSFA
jgi:iron-sulfur cluster assembly accessory protein